jgi:hypothetical protein
VKLIGEIPWGGGLSRLVKCGLKSGQADGRRISANLLTIRWQILHAPRKGYAGVRLEETD